MPTLEIPAEFLAGMNWIHAHPRELREAYAGRWIAVYRNRVVASGSSFGEVERQAIEKTNQPTNHLAIVFVDDPHRFYLLFA